MKIDFSEYINRFRSGFGQKQKVRKTNEGKINKMDKRTNLISDQNCNCLLGPKRKFAGFLQN